MTATSPTPPLDLDVMHARKVPFARLVEVELRKMADTRSGMWLLIAIGLVTAAIVTIFYFVANPGDRTFVNFLGATITPQGFLLPVLGILLVTSEWGQRTTLTTFTLEPSRARVVAAKIVAALLFGLAAIVLAMVIAALGALVGGADEPFLDIGASDLGMFGLLQVLGILQGLAFGLLLLNSAAAIVLYFVLPIASGIIVNLVPALRDIAGWIDVGTAQSVLFSGDTPTGEEWAQILVTSLVWIGVPFVLGLARVLRSELK